MFRDPRLLWVFIMKRMVSLTLHQIFPDQTLHLEITLLQMSIKFPGTVVIALMHYFHIYIGILVTLIFL